MFYFYLQRLSGTEGVRRDGPAVIGSVFNSQFSGSGMWK